MLHITNYVLAVTTSKNTAFCGVTYATDLGNTNILNVGKNFIRLHGVTLIPSTVTITNTRL